MSNYSIALFLSVLTFWSTTRTEVDTKEEINPLLEATYSLADTGKVKSPLQVEGTDNDTSKVKKNPNKHPGDPTRNIYVSPMFLKNPKNLTYEYELNEDGSGFYIYEKVGSVSIRRPSQIPYNDYLTYRREQGMAEYYKQKSLQANEGIPKGLIPSVDLGSVSDIFGGGAISVRPTGYATLDFSIDRNVQENPNLNQRDQRRTLFNFDQQIQLGVIGEIGEKLRLNANFDTQATFDFDNELKLKHEGTEDQILQSIEAGNVSMQLGNSLMQGRQNLFGIKSRLKFGPVYVTAIGSTERGQVESVRVGGNGAVETPFEKEVSQYDVDRHYFLSHYFRSRYEAALQNLPIINSPIRINRVQVWVERGGTTRDTRNGVGFTDLGENSSTQPGPPGFLPQGGNLFNTRLLQNQGASPFPDNEANDLYTILQSNSAFREMKSAAGSLQGAGFENTLDFEVAGNMRKLEPTEYTLNSQLGFISLNTRIPNDQVLFVAFNYTLNGQTFQVGEFSDDIPADGLNSNVLFLKMLKSTVLRPSYQDPQTLENRTFPLWDLMMKNIYNIGYAIKQTNFFLDIQYESGTSAGKINYFPDGTLKNKPLLQVMRLDQLTNHTAPGADFRFDYVEGLTMISDKGLVVFPVLEPFGEYLSRQLNDPNDSANYVFQALYEDTQVGAVQNFPHLDRFTLEGYYQSSSGGGSSEIPLNAFDLEEGSVTLTQAGRPLRDGIDYRVDYFGGKVIILNDAILTSGQEIEVNYESQSLYSIQTKTLLGTRVEYAPSQDLSLGATILNLREQPFNQKTTLGEEPINNTLWGFDGSVNRPSDFLTRIVDKLPLISTKETSQITGAAEFAQFIPGQPKVVQTAQDLGIVFLDDFEAAKTPYPLQGQRWRLASLPADAANPARMAVNLLPNSADPLAEGFTRARLSWYQIDQGFYQGLITSPAEDLVNNYTRRVDPNEIFPTARRAFGTNIQTIFDMNYDPAVRGPYNYQSSGTRLNQDGSLSVPEENWAGIMREIDINNDFEAANVEFLEFWLMDPFMDNPAHEGGELYFNLGLVSEDVLPDQGLSLENGLPKDGTNLALINETAWGRVPIGNPPTNNFERDEEGRANQDVGLDGLNDENERAFFQTYLSSLAGVLNGGALTQAQEDPSSDNFQHFRDDAFESTEAPILTRYENFNGMDGNTPFTNESNNIVIQGNQNPDTEDLNRNGSLNAAEQYWEYRIPIRPSELVVGRNFINDRIDRTDYQLSNGQTVDVTWYQFRIPIAAGSPVNGINNFKSINFVRMLLHGWKESTIMRMTEFQFVSTQWRRYLDNLSESSQVIGSPEPPFAEFEVGSLSLEENSQKLPFEYVLPPDVIQQTINGNTAQGFLQNERALQLNVCNLQDGDARAIFRNDRQDLRQYDSLRMWVHAEPLLGGSVAANFNQEGDVEVFLRLGLDNDFNYYEYILPVRPSDRNIGTTIREIVWSNEFNFKLSDLSAGKRERDNDPNGLITERYTYLKNGTLPNGHKIIIKGTPKLSDVRNIMIGVRNPKDGNFDPICAEIWVNELRLTDFDKSSGWAANANLNLRLADVAQINANFAHRTAGFGPLEQRVTDRTQSETTRYDVAVNFNLEKLTPKRWGLQMPVYATYGEQISNPVFDPREADVRTDVLLESISDEEERQEELEKIRDFRRNRSISMNNWKKIRTNPEKKTHFWDVENFDFTYAYNEESASSSVIEKRFATVHRGAINYRYNFKPLLIQPFKKAKPNNPLGLINFSPIPTSVSVSVLGNRNFEERKLRAAKDFGGDIPSSFTKNFLVTRNYNLVWSLTQNLQMNFNAVNNSRVDEVRGYWDSATQRERDSVGTVLENLLTFGRSRREVGGFERVHDNLINFGRNTNYMHNLNLTYQLPFAKFPLFNWINGNVNYAGTFQWQQAPEIQPELGGTVSNTQVIQANGRIDLKNLYSKWGFLKKIQDDYAKRGQNAGKPKEERVPVGPQRMIPATDSTKARPDPFWFLKVVGNEILRIAMSIQSVDLNISTNANTILPGYTPQTDNFGLDFRSQNVFGESSGILPPTIGFILGSQQDIRGRAAANGWITQDTTLSNIYVQNLSTQFTGRTSIELFRGFRIELNATRNEVKNGSSFFRYDPGFSTPNNPYLNGYRAIDPLTQGNFTMSYIFVNTAFERFRPEFSEAFEQFSQNRQIISARLAAENPNGFVLSQEGIVEGGYQNGYLGNNQEVVLPALLGSYGLIGANKVSLRNFPLIPLPNWSINYNGLSNIPFLKKYFNSVTLKHTYRATYSVGNFINNLNAEFDLQNGYVNNFAYYALPSGDSLENFFSVNSIANVAIREDFSPLLGLSMNMKNGMTASIDYKRGRMLNFSVGTLQLSELRNQDLAVMVGYRKEKLNLQFSAFGREFDLQNSMNFQFRLTMRDTRELNRNLGFDSANADPTLEPQYTRGTLNWIISPSIDYVVNTRLNLKFFYEQNINRPWTSQSYNTNFASGGIQLRFTLSN